VINCMPAVAPLLTITRGVPGCGKTTYAQKWVQDDTRNRSRLNRDDLRETMHGGSHGYPRELEDAVTVAHHAAVTALLLAGRDVITDDMNLSNKQVKAWMELARAAGADFDIVDLTNVPVETCIERDAARGNLGGHSVGAEYITQKHQQFIKGRAYPLPRPELKDPELQEIGRRYAVPLGKPKAVLVDLDGTMALMNGRGPFDWHRVGEDLANETVMRIVAMLADVNTYYEEIGDEEDMVEIIFMSGRDEVCRRETQDWLVKHGFSYTYPLFMRPSLPDGVNQPKDSIVKLALFDEHIRDNYEVVAVFDDRDQVVEMWRSIGLTCLQVAPGPF
jgi:predicted kinase